MTFAQKGIALFLVRPVTRQLLEEYTTTKNTIRISTGSKDSATKLVMLGGPASVILDHLSVI